MATTAYARGRDRPRIVQGKAVFGGPAFSAEPAIEIRGLRFYSCALAENNEPCTVVTGSIISRLPTYNFIVTVTLTMYEVPGTDRAEVKDRGRVQAVIRRPAPGKPTRFQALGPAWYCEAAKAQPGGEQWQPRYTLSVAVARDSQR